MAHRHVYNTSQIFDAEPDQHWDPVHAEDPYLHFGNNDLIVSKFLHWNFPLTFIKVMECRYEHLICMVFWVLYSLLKYATVLLITTSVYSLSILRLILI